MVRAQPIDRGSGAVPEAPEAAAVPGFPAVPDVRETSLRDLAKVPDARLRDAVGRAIGHEDAVGGTAVAAFNSAI